MASEPYYHPMVLLQHSPQKTDVYSFLGSFLHEASSLPLSYILHPEIFIFEASIRTKTNKLLLEVEGEKGMKFTLCGVRRQFPHRCPVTTSPLYSHLAPDSQALTRVWPFMDLRKQTLYDSLEG